MLLKLPLNIAAWNRWAARDMRQKKNLCYRIVIIINIVTIITIMESAECAVAACRTVRLQPPEIWQKISTRDRFVILTRFQDKWSWRVCTAARSSKCPLQRRCCWLGGILELLDFASREQSNIETRQLLRNFQYRLVPNYCGVWVKADSFVAILIVLPSCCLCIASYVVYLLYPNVSWSLFLKTTVGMVTWQ